MCKSFIASHDHFQRKYEKLYFKLYANGELDNS